MAPISQKVRIGTRASRMALHQAARVQALLQAQHPQHEFEVVAVSTRGDAQPRRPLHDFRRPGIFTSSLEKALGEGRIHVAVHSFKDLPVQMPDGLALAAVLRRDDPSDALVTKQDVGMDALPPGAQIGTSSPRRARMVRALNRGWRAVPIRGNVDSRIARLDGKPEPPYDGIIVATCGLQRLGLAHRVAHRFDLREYLTAPAQGAIALQCLAAATDTLHMLRVLHHPPTHLTTEAERGLLRHLGGGCALPTAAYARLEGDVVHLDARIWSPDGRASIGGCAQGPEPAAVSRQLAESLIAQGCQAWL